MKASVVIHLVMVVLIPGCTELPNKEGAPAVTSVKKPPSSYNDTLDVLPLSAVFYKPDSLQLQNIESVTSERVFKSSMHDYAFQTKHARKFLSQHKNDLHVYEIDHARFIKFIGKQQAFIVDLNKFDPVGLFVFDGTKPPQLVDMTNVETQITDYFSKDEN